MKVGRKMFLLHAIVLIVFLATGSSLPTFGISCTSKLTGFTNSRGVNRLGSNSKTPLYRLQITTNLAVNTSLNEATTYRVQIRAENELLPYTDAKILVASKGACGTGSLTFDHNQFFDVRQSGSSCPKLLLANQKLPMTELPTLVWKPPACGCIQFRALVVSFDGEYYKDNDDVDNGFLSQDVCINQKGTRELHLKTLCHVLERYSAAEIISRSSFMQRHQLEARWMDKHGLEMGLELRRSDNRMCCGKTLVPDKLACFNDARRRRVDRFCEDGYPDIPFTSFRLGHMRDREKKCCFLLGEHRYTCFNESNELKHGHSVTLLDFSQDEMDPVNDLAEFASTHDADVVTSIGAVQFGNDNSKEDDDNSDEENEGQDVEEEDDDKTQDQKTTTSLMKNKKTTVTEGTQAPSVTSRINRESQEMQKMSPMEGRLTSREGAPKIETVFMTSSERQKKTRKGGVPERGASAERVDSRPAPSRQFTDDTRRSSGERTARRRGSAERKHSTFPGFDEQPFRGSGTSRDRDLLTSSERRARGRSSGQRRQDWADVVDEPDFEDQGGKSSDFHLHKLQKQMDRLRLKEQCCRAGMQAGRHVYGSISHVKRECEDSRHKYISSAAAPAGVRHCHIQFIDCCIEKAVSGPVITSSEFRDGLFRYSSNNRRQGSAGGMSVLQREDEDWFSSPERAGRQSLVDRLAGDREEDEGRQLRGGTPPSAHERETPEAYEYASEKRFQSMRSMDDIPTHNEDDDEYNGPRRFDDADNDGYFDILERKDEMANRTLPAATADEEVTELDERNVINTTESERKRGTKLGTAAQHKKHTTEHKTAEPRDQLDRLDDFTERKETHFTDTSSSNENPLLLPNPVGRSSQARSYRAGGRSRTGKFNSRESRHRQPTGRSSRMTSQERRQQSKIYYSYGQPYKIMPIGKIGTEDSQEMAAAHGRKFIGALDSKEMVDAYKKTKPDLEGYASDSRYQRKRWSY